MGSLAEHITPHTEALLIAILRSELQQIPLDPTVAAELTPERCRELYVLAKSHDLAHIVASSLDKLGLMGTDEVSRKLQKQAMIAVYRCEQFRYAFGEICGALNAAEVDYIPLKGSVIRPYYPEESMRTSSDIDILIRKEDIPRAEAAVSERLSYQRSGESLCEISYSSPAGVHLELHYYDPQGNSDDMEFFSGVWEHCLAGDGARYDLPADLFLGYHIAHMAKHFRHGGCGLRPFMDLWIMEHKMGIDPHAADAVLGESGFLQFAKASFALSNVWFGDAEHTPLTQDLSDYLMHAGVYGSLENQSAVTHVKTGGGAKTFFFRVFPPYGQMIKIYPSLRSAPVLYPFYIIRRWLRILKTRGGKGTLARAKSEMNVSDAHRDSVASLLKNLEL